MTTSEAIARVPTLQSYNEDALVPGDIVGEKFPLQDECLCPVPSHEQVTRGFEVGHELGTATSAVVYLVRMITSIPCMQHSNDDPFGLLNLSNLASTPPDEVWPGIPCQIDV